MPTEAFLRRLRERVAQSDSSGKLPHTAENDLADGEVLEVRDDLVAVRLFSRLLDRELWLCRDERAAAEIAAEYPQLPALIFAEIPHLRGKPAELLHAILNARVEFPGAVLRA